MTTHHTYLLSNLSVNQFIEFQVAESDDVLAAARARLRESGLSDDVHGGFFVSVYPTGAESVQEDLHENVVPGTDYRDSSSSETVGEQSPEDLAGSSHRESEVVAPDAETSQVSDDDAASDRGPLAAAAAQGPMHWTDDPAIDPPGAPSRSGEEGETTPVIAVPLGAAGGH